MGFTGTEESTIFGGPGDGVKRECPAHARGKGVGVSNDWCIRLVQFLRESCMSSHTVSEQNTRSKKSNVQTCLNFFHTQIPGYSSPLFQS